MPLKGKRPTSGGKLKAKGKMAKAASSTQPHTQPQGKTKASLKTSKSKLSSQPLKGHEKAAPSSPKQGAVARGKKEIRQASAGVKKAQAKGWKAKPVSSKARSVSSFKPTGKTAKLAKPASRPRAIQSWAGLSPDQRYTVGGLCACLIDTLTPDGRKKLDRLLQSLHLSDTEQANLKRVAQGLTVPKLFADLIEGDETRRKVFTGLLQFAVADGQYEVRWRSEVRVIAQTLGISSGQAEQAEKRFSR